MSNLDPAAARDLPPNRPSLTDFEGRYAAVRHQSEALCEALETEDFVAQSMPDASPTKWHLAHTTWFFEVMVLEPFAPGYRPRHPSYRSLFNSYYSAVGPRHPRPTRGALTRPTVREIFDYRRAVDEAMRRWIESEPQQPEPLRLVELGLHHEQQHQELMLTDLKHLFSQSELRPAYRDALPARSGISAQLDWVPVSDGVYAIGHQRGGFAFDNEEPRHRVFLEDFALANRLVTNAEFQAFVRDGGYDDPLLWLDAGWATIQREGWRHPLYWQRGDAGWSEFTLAGQRALPDDEPVSHLSYLEADAFARWAGARLPTEAEWEVACADLKIGGNFAESGRFHPAPATEPPPAPRGLPKIRQAFGDLWEWTASSYSPYPGFRPPAGALGEYNGKFMCGQQVLRGGSCASPRSHLRASYRNFFYPPDRWQFSGLRLARSST